MNFLLTNDDGIDAQGLKSLEEAFAPLGNVYVVAPAEHQSGCSHTVTVDQPLELKEHSSNHYSLSGTPADCVRVAVQHLKLPIDWVVSGINHGGNLGADVFMSGTVAAVREASLLGLPGIAFSHFRRGEVEYDWASATTLATKLGRQFIKQTLDKHCFWNVNFPDAQDLSSETAYKMAPLEPEPLPVSYELKNGQLHYVWGQYVNRPQTGESDVSVCFNGEISVSLINLQTKNASASL